MRSARRPRGHEGAAFVRAVSMRIRAAIELAIFAMLAALFGRSSTNEAGNV